MLEEKWAAVRWIMSVQGLIYLLYLVLLSVFTCNFRDSQEFFAPIFVINIFLLLYEFYQMILNKLDYWTDMWNYLDVIRGVLCIVYGIEQFVTMGSENETLLTLLTLFSWIRGITYFRLFDQTRYMVNLLKFVVEDMISFLALLFYSTLAFSFIFMAMDKGGSFSDYLTQSWSLDLGDFNTDGFGAIQWIIFFLASMINPLIMLNLLISIMGNTYDRVQDGQEIADRKELCEMIIEAETMLYWRRNLGEKVYMQMLSEQQQLTAAGDWMGRVRELKIKLIQNNMILKQSIEKQNEQFTSIRENFAMLLDPEAEGGLFKKIEGIKTANEEAIKGLKEEQEKKLNEIKAKIGEIKP